MEGIRWKWKDPAHFEAHEKEFIRPVEEILEELSVLLSDMKRAPGDTFHQDFCLSAPVGFSGLVEVPVDGSRSFWGYRKGRGIPSHLCIGEKIKTNMLCLWGWWEKDSLFVIHTVYPGKVAPREIHDPELHLEDIAQAVAFWSTHAIIVKEGEYHAKPCTHKT